MSTLLLKLTGGGRRGIPSLDGLRALSILLVIFGHLHGTRYFLPAETPGQGVDWNWGNLGVRVFFVISGFLITTLMLQEWEKTGTLSLRSFYFRRTLRIFPPFLVFLACMLVLTQAGVLAIPWREFVYAATYTMNFSADRGWNLGHLWSLAVEEQFYLLWPFVMVALGVRKALRCALAVVLISPFLRLGLSYALPSQIPGIGNTFYTIADPLAIGCCLAGYSGELSKNLRYQAFLRSNWIYAIAASIPVVNALPGTKLSFLIYQSFLNLAIAVLLDSVVHHPNRAAGRFLNWSPLRAIGVLSYSLYLWQQLFVDHGGTYGWNAFPANVVLAGMAALLSFYLVELPALSLRKKAEVRPNVVAAGAA